MTVFKFICMWVGFFTLLATFFILLYIGASLLQEKRQERRERRALQNVPFPGGE